MVTPDLLPITSGCTFLISSTRSVCFVPHLPACDRDFLLISPSTFLLMRHIWTLYGSRYRFHQKLTVHRTFLNRYTCDTATSDYQHFPIMISSFFYLPIASNISLIILYPRRLTTSTCIIWRTQLIHITPYETNILTDSNHRPLQGHIINSSRLRRPCSRRLTDPGGYPDPA